MTQSEAYSFTRCLNGVIRLTTIAAQDDILHLVDWKAVKQDIDEYMEPFLSSPDETVDDETIDERVYEDDLS